MKILKTKLKGVLLIKPDIFRDFRGQYIETYNERLYRKHGINVKFREDDISVSRRNVLRGIHGDPRTAKLISCPYGEFYFVAINCNRRSRDFGKWVSFVLSDKNRWQVFVPAYYGNAHLVLSRLAIFHYKQSAYYDPKRQFTYKWDDPRFKIHWPIKRPILSERDRQARFI